MMQFELQFLDTLSFVYLIVESRVSKQNYELFNSLFQIILKATREHNNNK